ncbi:MAG: hypothetical protein BWY79_01803 [Actinobacteria bacterium ADurb.Bin444]|nr:MAG: hypothetical protein BWY79_01803 [Actinobacteria bacterium ADurb.Bin444]
MPRRRRFLSVTGLWAMFTIGVASAIVGPSLPALVQEFAISWGHAGRLFAAQYGGKLLAVAIIWAGGRRLAAGAIAGIGGIVLATGLLLVGAVPSFSLVLAAVLLYGLGHGSLDVGCNSLLTQVLQPAPGERGTVTAGLNVLHLFFGIGALSGPVVVAVRQTRLALGRGIASKILVEPLEG